MSAESSEWDSKLHEILGEAIRNPEFASELLDRERQAAALGRMGVTATPEVLEEVNHAIHHLEHLWEAFSETKQAS